MLVRSDQERAAEDEEGGLEAVKRKMCCCREEEGSTISSFIIYMDKLHQAVRLVPNNGSEKVF